MKILANFLYLSGGEAISKAVSFAMVTYLARVVGPVGYGYVEFAGAVLLCAGLIVDQGLGLFGAREIAKSPHRTAALVSDIVVVRFFLSLIAYTAMIGFALLLNRSALLTQLILIYGLSLIVSPLLLQWVFQGHNHMQSVAAMQCIRQTLIAAVILLLVHDEAHIWLVAVGEVIGACCAAAFGLWLYSSKFDGPRFVRPSISWRLFREGVPIGLSQMFWMIRMFGATVLVGIIATPQDLGYFGSAMRVLIALHTFIWLYFFNLLPLMSKTWQMKDDAFALIISNSLHLISWITMIGGLIWVLVAPIAITFVYGVAFAPAGTALQWLAGVGVTAALSGHYRFGLIAAGHQNAEMLIGAVAAITAIIAVPIGYSKAGPPGASIGLFATELLVWALAWWWSRQHLGLHGHLKFLFRPLIVTVFAVSVSWMLPLAPPLFRIATATSLYAVAAFSSDPILRRRSLEIVEICRPWLRRHLVKNVEVA